jgi:hypothetical protein
MHRRFTPPLGCCVDMFHRPVASVSGLCLSMHRRFTPPLGCCVDVLHRPVASMNGLCLTEHADSRRHSVVASTCFIVLQHRCTVSVSMHRRFTPPLGCRRFRSFIDVTLNARDSPVMRTTVVTSRLYCASLAVNTLLSSSVTSDSHRLLDIVRMISGVLDSLRPSERHAASSPRDSGDLSLFSHAHVSSMRKAIGAPKLLS